MLMRLGYVLYWLGNIAAALIVLSAVLVLGSGVGAGPAAFLAVIALCAWLAGRACRYVLAGQ
jgi:hypothetical protein